METVIHPGWFAGASSGKVQLDLTKSSSGSWPWQDANALQLQKTLRDGIKKQGSFAIKGTNVTVKRFIAHNCICTTMAWGPCPLLVSKRWLQQRRSHPQSSAPNYCNAWYLSSHTVTSKLWIIQHLQLIRWKRPRLCRPHLNRNWRIVDTPFRKKLSSRSCAHIPKACAHCPLLRTYKT